MSRPRSVLSPPHERSNGPGDGATRRHRTLRRLAIAASASTYLLIAVGAVVRATGSGDACPDWPRCHGRWIPPLEYHDLIEYSHRLTASAVVVVVAVLATHGWRRYREVPRVVWPAVGALGVVILQALIGAVVVWTDLQALNVTAHFATAMLLTALVVYATVTAHSVDAAAGPPDPLAKAARWVAGATMLLLLVGAWVRGEGAGLAFPDWPLMDGSLFPGVSSFPATIHFAHRVLAAVVGILVGWLAVRAWRDREARPATATLAVAAAGLFAVQILVGAANVWARLSAPLVVAHVVVSSLIWGALVATAATARLRSMEGRFLRSRRREP
jgi:heme A synthase